MQYSLLMLFKSFGIVLTVMCLAALTGCNQEDALSTTAQTITYGGIYIDPSVTQEITDYNSAHSDYQIQVIDYSSEPDPELKLASDMITGHAPDVIDLAWLSVNQYATKGVLEDLTPYYENDVELKTTDIIPSIWESMRTGDAHYYIAPGFNLQVLIAKSQDVGDASGWTVEDVANELEKKGSSVCLLPKDEKTDLLNVMLRGNLDNYVDWNTGACNFDCEEFRKILELCNEYSMDTNLKNQSDAPTAIEMFSSGQALLLEPDSALNIQNFLIMESILQDDITYIGYPNIGKSGTYFAFNVRLGIYSGSKQKEGAWSFIRTFMTKEYQGTIFTYSGYTPTRQDCLDLQLEAAKAQEPYTNEMGMDITPRFLDGEYDGASYTEEPMTDAQETRYLQVLDQTKRCDQSNNTLNEMIKEEANDYFSGKKSLDETVQIIQERATTYVNEQK